MISISSGQIYKQCGRSVTLAGVAANADAKSRRRSIRNKSRGKGRRKA
jgi:hypothetical protein